DPQHVLDRSADGRGVLGVPPLLHRQAEDPGHRWPRRPLREAVRQAERRRHRRGRSRQVATPTAPVPTPRGEGTGAVVVSAPIPGTFGAESPTPFGTFRAESP